MDRVGPREAGVAERRFYCPERLSQQHSVALGPEAARHAQVLRLSIGAAVELFDGQGAVADAAIESLGRGQLELRITSAPRQQPPRPKLTLVPCATKGQKLEDVVRMTTELGVAAIRPAWSSRSVLRGDAESAHKKHERWRRVAIEATRQSEGAYVPEVGELAPLAEVLAQCPPEATRLACIERTAQPWAPSGELCEVWLVVGPEGGLAADDRRVLAEHGFSPISLGHQILRAETASVVGVARLLPYVREWR